jgi:hypothetical protein
MLRKHFWPAAILAQSLLATCALAQPMDDIELRREGRNAVVQVRFTNPVQFQRSITAKSGDLVQVFYTVLPGADAGQQALTGSRRASTGRGVPDIVITDDAVSSDNLNKRVMVIRLSASTPAKVRAGKRKDSIELVLEGVGDALVLEEAKAAAIDTSRRFAIVLQSSTDATAQLGASIPAQLQNNEVFTSRRISEGKTVFDTSLGYFATLAEAESAQKLLLRRFPNASVIPLQTGSVGTGALAAVPGGEAASPAAPATQADAGQLMAKAVAADDRGDFQDAVSALDTLLNLPPNAYSRKAQEMIGVARLKAGDTQRARGEFETFIKLYPTGADTDLVRQYLANLPKASEEQSGKKSSEPTAVTSGSVSVFYYGGQSKTNQDCENTPVGCQVGVPGQSEISGVDQKQVQTNVDLNWRYRDKERDQRFVFRDTYSADLMPNRPNKNRLSALYFEQRDFTNGTSFKVGRQSPSGGGTLYRYDGAQAGYVFAPKWKVNAAYGVPTDALLRSQRSFYGAWIDADALGPHFSGSAYVNQQMIDGEVDRRGLGLELRYFNEGIALSSQVDYDQMMQAVNIASLQGSWQFPDSTVINFLVDKRATPIRSLGNVLFFPSLTGVQANSLTDLLATTPIDILRDTVNGNTSFQSQAMLGFTTPINANWQTGANVNYTNVGAIPAIPSLGIAAQAGSGDVWSVGLQLIGSNLYSSRDTHVFSLNLLSGEGVPPYSGVLLSYNNLTAINEEWQIEPSLRYYTSNVSNAVANTVQRRLTPGLRVTYRVVKSVALESEVSYEISKTESATSNETATRIFYYVGGRFDF